MNQRLKTLFVLAVFIMAATPLIAASQNTDAKVICPVMKNEVKDIKTAPSFEYKGKTYYFCCAGCVDKFKADPEKYLKSDTPEQQSHGEHAMHMDDESNGKNNICPVMGGEVKDHETAPQFEYGGKTYYFCCAGCIAKFKEDPEKYIAFLDEKVTCPVSGEEITVGEAAGVHEHDGKTYYFCCPNCKETFLTDPAKYIK